MLRLLWSGTGFRSRKTYSVSGQETGVDGLTSSSSSYASESTVTDSKTKSELVNDMKIGRSVNNSKNCCTKGWKQLNESTVGISSVMWYTYNLFSDIVPKMSPHHWRLIKKSMFCKMLTILCLQSLEIVVTYPIKYLSNSIMKKDVNGFYYWSIVVSIIALIAFPVVIFDNTSHALFYIQLRESVTKVLLQMYYDKQAFYYLNQNMNKSYSLNKDHNELIIDNCGQRLCMDVLSCFF
ncbi:hypothetical protein RFI_36725 [Reticulomyxa filosa]|uniref:ABC transmembrane type-1 domain-containing protein n=1 Tax=Reticulomyxa filosa TaxID=46433 RepID=X6LH51_RETFI|nr:hypothetical protein RFI_36725 [Reticulomyxa filosa]|eukprot:ETO00716.1 hypothetical protein RFI_36725 [Reticulomyxa filosa]